MNRPDEDAIATRKRTRAATASVATAVTLVLLKVVAGTVTGSLSLFASAVDSLMDIFASLVNFVAVRTASRPADADHAYGHGKAEGLSGLFQGVIIGASGLYLGYESVVRLFRPRPLEAEGVGIAVMAISTAASYLLVRYLRRAARETDSIALEADSIHYATDVVTNVGVLMTIAIVAVSGFEILDPIVSLVIGVYILYAAFGLFRTSTDHLMDRALPEEIHDEARRIALEHPEIRGVHDIKSRAVGARRFIELHLEVDGSRTLREAHDASVEVLRAIEREIPNSKVFVHTDPV
jgi:ferrous-iron efflux pump FieF